MEPRFSKYGDVVQINPDHDDKFGGCFMLVIQPKIWGAQGECISPKCEGVYPYRCEFKNMEFVGVAPWAPMMDNDE